MRNPRKPGNDAERAPAPPIRRNNGSCRHGRASPSRVTHGRQPGFVRHNRRQPRTNTPPHERIGSARRAFSGVPRARRINAVSMCSPRARRAPGIRRSRSPEAPQHAQSANPRRNPRKRPQTTRRHTPRATAVSPLYSSRIDSLPSSRRARTTMRVPARFRSTPSMPYPNARGAAGERFADPRPRLGEPRKSPICRCKPAFPANKVMHPVLHRLRKSHMMQLLARKAALLTPVSLAVENSTRCGTPHDTSAGLPAGALAAASAVEPVLHRLRREPWLDNGSSRG